MNVFTKKILSKKELQDIASVIAESEKQTSGEIRVAIRHKRRSKEKQLSMHELALQEFYRLGMDKTRDKTGVLIFILVSEKKFHIVGDEGIHSNVSDGTWDRIADTMSSHFKLGNYFDGIVEAVRAVTAELSKYFPKKDDDRDELPNEVVEH
jgi:uncharacterized membrane protein